MSLFAKLRVGARLGIAFSIVLLLLLVSTAFGLRGIDRMYHGLEALYVENVLPMEVANQIDGLLTRNRILVMDMLIQRDAAHIDKRDADLRSNITKLDQLWSDLDKGQHSADERKIMDAFKTARTAYLAEGLLPTRDAARAGDFERALKLYADKVSPLAAAAKKPLDEFVAVQVREGREDYDDGAAIRTRMIAVSAAAAAVALVLGGLLAWGITRSVTGPALHAATVASRVRDGDLRSSIDAQGGDEMAQMLVSMREMQTSLSGIVQQVRDGADSVATASAQIAQGNQDLSGRTEQQASALQQTAATMDELASTVRNNADNAKQANQLALGASGVAERGGAVVQQVVETMRGISDSSRKIADIIGVIDGIAFQTNILALNAAVEAARAGEQGRGFAVVAGEVRNLAQRSAESAREIKSLITASVERVERGTSLVGEAGQTMQEVVAAVKRVSDIVGEISSASVEQSAGVGQVGQAVSQMDQATQQNAALVEESAAAAESLRQQAQQLVQAVSVFKLA